MRESYTDDDLWTHFLQGDKNAYAKLYERFFHPLYNYACKFTTNTALIEDSLHDLFLQVWKSRLRLNAAPGSVKNYLFKAIRHHIFHKLKAEQKNTRTSADDPVFDLRLNRETEIIQEEQLARLQQQLAKALVTLTPRQREAIFLRYYENFSYPEIARMLGLSQKATYKLIGRAISQLRKLSIADFTPALITLTTLLLGLTILTIIPVYIFK